MKKYYSQNRINLIKKREIETWIYSYADLVTNLLALFIMLFILSNSSSKAKADFIRGIETYVDSKSYETGRIGTGKSEVDNFHQLISEVIQKSELSGQVSLTRSKTGIEMVFESALVFDVGTATLKEESLLILQQVAAIVKDLPENYFLIVEGHADSRPVTSGVYPSNWELSSARAGSVVRSLQANGVQASKMRAIGYSDTRPIDDDTESERNRRVVVKIDSDKGGGM